MNIRLSGLFLVLALLSPFSLLAVTEIGTGSNLSSEISPREPKAGDMVTLKINGFGFDVNKAIFEWFKDGQKIRTSMGGNTFSFQLGSLGTRTRVAVSVYTGNRKLGERQFYFEPSEINFLWEADTFTPHFYQGKPLASVGSTLKIVALPYLTNQEGQRQSTSNLIFAWQVNGQTLDTASGQGKNILTLVTEPNQSQAKIDLRVSTLDGKNSTSKSLIIPLNKAELIFYELKPLFGLDPSRAISTNYELYEEEVSFLGVPFFWPNDQIKNISYLWRVNNLETSSGGKNTLTVRQPSGGLGQNEISLQIKDSVNSINNRFNIKFGNNLLRFNNDIQ